MDKGLKMRNFIILLIVISSGLGCARDTHQWQKARITNTIESYEDFIAAYPDSIYVKEARSIALELAWKKAKRADTVDAYESFLEKYPEDTVLKLGEQARTRIDELKTDTAWQTATEQNTIASYKAFLGLYTDKAPFSKDARLRLYKLEFKGFMKSVEKGDIKTLKHFLNEGHINVNAKDVNGYNALHRACRAGNLECATLLLQKGADPNEYVYNKQESASHKITCDRRTGVVMHKLGLGSTPLLFACEKGDARMAALLLRYRADVNLAGKEGLEYATPLCAAIVEGHTAIVDLLVKYKANVNQKGAKVIMDDPRMGKITMALISPLALADRTSNRAIRQILVKSGAK